MDLIASIILGTFLAVVGAVVSMILPSVVRWFIYRKHDLIGNWYSIYQPYHYPHVGPDEWINEQVEIDLHHSKFRFRAINNELEHRYIAKGTIRNKIDIIGDWESVREDATASGVFMLTIAPRGGILYGHFTGPRETGERVFGAWVLARKKEQFEEGLRLLTLST
ncbi:hypothetical protein ACFLW8_06315 [Chloroflexota bacterium]